MNRRTARADATKSGRWAQGLLILAGAVSAAVYLALAVLSREFTHNVARIERPGLVMLGLLGLAFAIYLMGLRVALRCPQGGRLLGAIVVGSVLFRLLLVFSWPIQEIDIYRYLWDGEVTTRGVDPFRYCPQQVLDAGADDLLPDDLRRLVQLRDSSPAVATILSRVHYEELPTIYPPVSQAVFAFCSTITPTGATVFWRLVIMKACFVAFDLGTLGVVMGLLRLGGRHPGWSLAYGWCPLVIKETANSGHLDAIAVFLAAAAVLIAGRALFRGRSPGGGVWAAAVLGLAVGAKLYPVILVPLLALSWIRRFGWVHTVTPAAVFVAVVTFVLWPMIPGVGTKAGDRGNRPSPREATRSALDPQDPGRSLKVYLGRWEMNDFLFMLAVENVKPDGNRDADDLAWFTVVPDTWRTAMVERPAAWLELEPSAAGFLLTRLATSALFLGLICTLGWRVAGCREPVEWLEAVFLTTAWFWLLSPTQFPWYWTWAMPFLMFARGRAWLAVSGLTLVYYVRFWLASHWPDDPVPVLGYSGRSAFNYVITWLEFAPWFVLLMTGWVSRAFRVGRGEGASVGERHSAVGPDRLIVFSRYPRPGKTKTRLIPALGPRGAAGLQREMTRHTLRWARELFRGGGASVEVHFEGGTQRRMRRAFGHDLSYLPQPAGDLGKRLAWAFSDAFAAGARRVAIVGTDCPGLSRALTEDALARLSEHDLVLGPAVDGGYYLIGMRRNVPELFDDIAWGTGEVLQTTLQKADELNLAVSLLETLADVDRPEDLEIWHRASAGVPRASDVGEISVIVPTLDEEDDLLAKALGSIGHGRDVEAIVVDACRHDSTRQVAQAHGARVLSSLEGRARQMNAGAAQAGGEILLFLHADTRLPADFGRHVRRTLQEPGVSAGAFGLSIEGASGTLRWIARAANLRARLLRMPYGDQALFLRAETFRGLGGFSDIPILEDVDLIRRLRRTGRVVIAPAKVVTSARRWLELGVWRTTWINQRIMIGYRLGVSHQRLARWYQGRKKGP